VSDSCEDVDRCKNLAKGKLTLLVVKYYCGAHKPLLFPPYKCGLTLCYRYSYLAVEIQLTLADIAECPCELG